MDKNLATTPLMATVEFSWVDVETQAKHVINLLKTQSDEVVSIATGILKLIKAVTGRDMLGVMSELSKLTIDIQALISAVRLEFDVVE